VAIMIAATTAPGQRSKPVLARDLEGSEVRWWSQPTRLVAINVFQLQARLMCG
jgi:hypothetical protein